MNELSVTVLVLVNVAAWFIIHMGFAWGGTMLPRRVFRPECRVFRLRAFERNGALYERLFRIKAWKGLLPDGAKLFKQGFPKARLVQADADYLQQFIRETCRGEAVHWAVFLASGLFFLWNPPAVAVWMVAYGIVSNLPCILAQRYNRIRMQRLVRKQLGRRVEGTPSEAVGGSQ